MNENENLTYKNVWDTVKDVPRRKYTATNITVAHKKYL
jgi:hypothetical protein